MPRRHLVRIMLSRVFALAALFTDSEHTLQTLRLRLMAVRRCAGVSTESLPARRPSCAL